MTREDLLKTDDYHIANIQIGLYGVVEEYMKKNHLNRTQLGQKLGVSKSYITQLLSGDYDHKVSKMVELSLASDKIPVIHFVDIDDYIKNDSQDKYYELVPMKRPCDVSFTTYAKHEVRVQNGLYFGQENVETLENIGFAPVQKNKFHSAPLELSDLIEFKKPIAA